MIRREMDDGRSIMCIDGYHKDCDETISIWDNESDRLMGYGVCGCECHG